MQKTSGTKIWRIEPLPESPFALLHGAKYWPPVFKDEDVLDRNEPMHIEFVPSSLEIAEFTWVWGMNVCISCQIEEELKQFSGWEPLNTYLVKTKDKSRTKPTVPFPYDGPELNVLWVTHWVTMNEVWSTFMRRQPEPGLPNIEFYGIEECETKWDPDTDEVELIYKKREPGKGIFVEKGDLGNCDFFRIRQWPGAMMCTDRVRDFAIKKGYRNVMFLEAGDVIEDVE